jgi:hypothetical protein
MPPGWRCWSATPTAPRCIATRPPLFANVDDHQWRPASSPTMPLTHSARRDHAFKMFSRSEVAKAKALTTHGALQERATGVEPATFSLGSLLGPCGQGSFGGGSRNGITQSGSGRFGLRFSGTVELRCASPTRGPRRRSRIPAWVFSSRLRAAAGWVRECPCLPRHYTTTSLVPQRFPRSAGRRASIIGGASARCWTRWRVGRGAGPEHGGA